MCLKKCRGFNKAESDKRAHQRVASRHIRVIARLNKGGINFPTSFLSPFFSPSPRDISGIITVVYFNLALSRVIYLLHNSVLSYFLRKLCGKRKQDDKKECYVRIRGMHFYARSQFYYQQKFQKEMCVPCGYSLLLFSTVQLMTSVVSPSSDIVSMHAIKIMLESIMSF